MLGAWWTYPNVRYKLGVDERPDRKEYERRRHLKSHGLTLEQYEHALVVQGGLCAVCGTDKPGKRGFHVDHDHNCCPRKTSCGKCVRGLLCHNCNVGLGLLGDSPDRLRNAVAYLEARTGLHEPGFPSSMIQTTGKPHKNNTSGLRGVARRGDKWQAQIGMRTAGETLSRRKTLGTFDTAQEAVVAWNRASREYFGKLAFQNPV